jgi:uncharacterized protein (DUF697 family)/predicted GTPase
MNRSEYWKMLGRRLFAPKVSEEELDEYLRKIRSELPVPVFWLFGKAQSGKTSLIRALTGSSRAEIGNGFRPCTRTANLYPFPDEADCFLQFLDTRGLGEAEYDPEEDMQVLEEQAHLMVVVIKAIDHAQQSVLQPLEKILKAHPRWPLIVVQTSLHEGYPDDQADHIEPYPFKGFPYGDEVPSDLARSLSAQREWFKDYDARFVPVDLTLPEDGFATEHYGLDALWEAIEDAVPLGLRSMMQQTREVRKALRGIYFRTAHPHILSYAIAAGAAAGVSPPVIDIPLVIAVQAKMFHTIATIYDQPMDRRRVAEISGTLGLGYLAQLGGRGLMKVVPGFGSAVAGLYAAASTYALGRTLCAYFSYMLHGDVPDKDALRKLYAEEYEEGRRRLRVYLENLVGRQEAPT